MEEKKVIAFSKEKKLINERLIELMKAKNISPGKLSLMTGIGHSDLNKLLTGTKNQTDETRLRLMEALGVTMYGFNNTPAFDEPIIMNREDLKPRPTAQN